MLKEFMRPPAEDWKKWAYSRPRTALVAFQQGKQESVLSGPAETIAHPHHDKDLVSLAVYFSPQRHELRLFQGQNLTALLVLRSKARKVSSSYTFPTFLLRTLCFLPVLQVLAESRVVEIVELVQQTLTPQVKETNRKVALDTTIPSIALKDRFD